MRGFFELPFFRAILPLSIEGNRPNFFICIFSLWFYVSLFTLNAYGMLGAWFICTVWSTLSLAINGREAS